jgi:hypothetical protein
MRGFCRTFVAALCVAVAAPAAAAAQSPWSPVSSPVPAGGYVNLHGVSCATAGFCMAVGTNDFSHTWAQRWDGTAWSAVPIPDSSNQLHDVSCSSPQWCVAVGQAFDNPVQGLIRHWDGSAWTDVPTPPVADVADLVVLSGVSCAAPNACVAVGRWEDQVSPRGATRQSLAMHWDGSSWEIEPVATVPTDQVAADALTDVSCPSADACFAVGSISSGAVATPLVERWDGTRWTPHPATPPAGGIWSGVTGVSCASAAFCIAVGSYGDAAGGGGTLVITGGLGPWVSVPTPDLGGVSSSLEEVSCAGVTACVAVGHTTDAEFVDRTLAQRWDGVRLVTEPTPNPENARDSLLTGVSCPAADGCHAVGWYFERESSGAKPGIALRRSP